MGFFQTVEHLADEVAVHTHREDTGEVVATSVVPKDEHTDERLNPDYPVHEPEKEPETEDHSDVVIGDNGNA